MCAFDLREYFAAKSQLSHNKTPDFNTSHSALNTSTLKHFHLWFCELTHQLFWILVGLMQNYPLLCLISTLHLTVCYHDILLKTNRLKLRDANHFIKVSLLWLRWNLAEWFFFLMLSSYCLICVLGQEVCHFFIIIYWLPTTSDCYPNQSRHFH